MGGKHPSSMHEQQMGLVGFKIDRSYVIKYVFPSYINRISGKQARMYRGTIEQALRETDILKENFFSSDDRDDYIGEGLMFLGFAHSHPSQKELCYSVGDERLHDHLMKRFGDYIGILINPSEDSIGAYFGKEMKQGNLKLVIADKTISR